MRFSVEVGSLADVVEENEINTFLLLSACRGSLSEKMTYDLLVASHCRVNAMCILGTSDDHQPHVSAH
jgi:hypothetical protein